MKITEVLVRCATMNDAVAMSNLAAVGYDETNFFLLNSIQNTVQNTVPLIQLILVCKLCL